MKGDEYAQTRKILLAPLSGNAAFKDEAIQNRWKEKQKAKRTVSSTAEDGQQIVAAATEVAVTEESTTVTEEPAEPNVNEEAAE